MSAFEATREGIAHCHLLSGPNSTHLKWRSDCPGSVIVRRGTPHLHHRLIPWDANRTALYRAIFPQMTGCLPLDEGAQLRFDFATEMARLEAA
jgi:hypothetical protein